MSRRRIRLRGIGPHLEGKFWEGDSVLRVGRLESLEVTLNDGSISRRHAEVIATEQGWVVRDLGSTNGTFLNGVRVGRTDRKLRQRDVLQCGNLVMVVAVLEDESAPVPVETPSRGMQVQASTQTTWEGALEAIAFDGGNRPRAGDKLLTLLRASHHLCHIVSEKDLLNSILEDAVSALDAQRGAIVLVDDATGQLSLKAISTGERETAGRVFFSKSLAQRSFSKGESLLCRDVRETPELLMAHSIADGTMSSIICALLRSPRKRLGVLHLDRGPFQEPFSQEDLHLADALAASVSAGIESAELLRKQRDLFQQTITALANSVELRDLYTGNHTQRVTDYSLLLAEELSLSPQDRDLVKLGTPLHDIGKIGIPDEILNKKGKLTPEEFEIMKSHTLKGAAILETIPDLTPIIPIVRNHHERWDGRGYPDGLSGDKIPHLARIVAVADAFDAMTTDRPYRRGMTRDEAFAQVRDGAGSQFDPVMAEAFLRIRQTIEEQIQHRLHSDPDTLLPPVVAMADEEPILEKANPPTARLRTAASG